MHDGENAKELLNKHIMIDNTNIANVVAVGRRSPRISRFAISTISFDFNHLDRTICSTMQQFFLLPAFLRLRV